MSPAPRGPRTLSSHLPSSRHLRVWQRTAAITHSPSSFFAHPPRGHRPGPVRCRLCCSPLLTGNRMHMNAHRRALPSPQTTGTAGAMGEAQGTGAVGFPHQAVQIHGATPTSQMGLPTARLYVFWLNSNPCPFSIQFLSQT